MTKAVHIFFNKDGRFDPRNNGGSVPWKKDDERKLLLSMIKEAESTITTATYSISYLVTGKGRKPPFESTLTEWQRRKSEAEQNLIRFKRELADLG